MNELFPRGMEVLRSVSTLAAGKKDPAAHVARELGILSTTAGSWLAASKNWVGIKKELADEVRNFTVVQLQIISQAMNKSTDPEAVRMALVSYATTPGIAGRLPTADELKRKAQGIVAQKGPKKPRRSLLFGRQEDATGMRFAQLALPAGQMERLEALVRKFWPGDKEKEKKPALKNAIGLMRLLEAQASPAGDDQWDLSLAPAFIVSIPDTNYVGDGNFVTTNGDVINGADFANTRLSPYGYTVIYDARGNIGACYMLKSQRHASKEQRAALAIDHIFCSVEGCHELAIYSEAHHIKAWKNGGKTTIDNLLPLCRAHNRQNDDDRYTTGKETNGGWSGRDKHGRAGHKHQGEEELRYNQNYGIEYSGHAIAQKQLGISRTSEH